MGSANAKYCDQYGMNRAEFRQMLYARQHGICPLCTLPLPKGYVTSRFVNLDHRIPRSHGGPDDPSNIDLVHKECNLRKADLCPGCRRCRDDTG